MVLAFWGWLVCNICGRLSFALYAFSVLLRHDMKNHIIALSTLAKNQEWEKIGSYLEKMETIVLDGAVDMTGNKAVDALLYQKRKQAEEEGTQWECDVQMPKGWGINEFDLCVLFGNILVGNG